MEHKSKPAKWYSINARADADAAEINIYGDIGASWWDDESITAKQFVKDLSTLDAKEITVRVNSYGGAVADALAIYNALKRHPAAITTVNDGVAMSSASLILMAGDTVEMSENALLMIHAPWGNVSGNAKDMRVAADMLDKWAAAMQTCYARSALLPDEIAALLTDGEDHFYTADEAETAGFIDTVLSSSEQSFPNASKFMAVACARFKGVAKPPSPVSQPLSFKKDTTMTKENTTTVDAVESTPAPHPVAGLSKNDILAAEQARREAVRAQFTQVAGRYELSALAKKCEDDIHCTPEIAASRILAELGKDVVPVNGLHVETVEDETDKRRAGIVASLLTRAGVADADTRRAAAASEYRGAKLLDLAKAALTRANFKHGHLDQIGVVAAAFTQSTSDFPIVLENVMHKALLSAYATASDTWTRFCATGSVSDFRAHNRYRLGSFGNLDPVNELGEFTNKTIPDGEKASVSIGTKGNIINISRQAVINDDLGAFVGLAAQLGRAARRSIEADVYALLAMNGGLGPVLSDGKTLFHADHGNIGASAQLAVEALDADRVLMASQTDISGNEFLDLRPSVLLVPIALGGTARVINGAEYDPDTPNKLQRPNKVNGLFADIVDTPRLSGTRRYLFAAPGDAPTLEVSFLDGQSEPYLEQQQGYDVDGTRYKVRLDYGVTAVDYRGAVTNAGA